mmetsp:Transcript_33686/g.46641  ORF Transcript_33686/g.46641 Transcript_33686/m.46641 type:complete len:335 (+) Transcript_33686:1-1005(+)
MFNHRTGGEHIHLEDDENESDEDDEDEEEDDDEESEEKVEAGNQNDDDGEVDGKEDEEEEGDGALGSGSHALEEEDGVSNDASQKDTIDITTVHEAEAGKELFNTFGIHSNGTLIHRYGFAEADNELVTVQIDTSLVDEVLGKDAVKKAAAAFEQQWDAEDYTFEIDPEGTVDDELKLVIWSVHATAEEMRSQAAVLFEEERERVMPQEEAASLLEVLTKRLEGYHPEGGEEQSTTATEDKEAWRALMEQGAKGGASPAGGGCTGRAAALLLRAQEKQVLELAFVTVLKEMKAAGESESSKGGGKRDASKKDTKPSSKKKRKVEGTPYDPVIYL